MAPDSDKWTLLINVGSDQAARNGKNHHAIMQQVWEHTKTLTDLPSKDEMRRLLLSLLDSVWKTVMSTLQSLSLSDLDFVIFIDAIALLQKLYIWTGLQRPVSKWKSVYHL